MAKKPGQRSSKLSVYLYIPNIIGGTDEQSDTENLSRNIFVFLENEILLNFWLIVFCEYIVLTPDHVHGDAGYMRVLLNCFAFSQCLSNKILFSILYFLSFVCDAVDGWCARKFNQVSTFGAVLDMVTDRISTACLLVVLSQLYKPSLIFLSLLALDIASHWLQMYSTFLTGKTSHKDVKDSSSWLFRAYYGNRMFMAYCCVSCEASVLYLILFYLVENQTQKLVDVISSNLQKISLLSLLMGSSLFGWAAKQIINVIQMKTASDACVLYDIEKKHKN
ncbi:CDP-diacylglycerol--inositol 3-phosphatidyltransferase 1 [Glycine soja]